MDFLIKNLLNVRAVEHREVQEEIWRNLRNLGYYVKLEKKILARREGKIDVFAQKGNFSVGIEIDYASIKKKSVDKLNVLKPDVAVYILRAGSIDWKSNYSKAKFTRVKTLLIHLPTRSVRKLNPYYFYNNRKPNAKA